MRTTFLFSALVFSSGLCLGNENFGRDPYLPSLSEKEEAKAANYVPEALIYKSIEEACSKDEKSRQVCDEEEPDTFGLPPWLVENASRLTSMFFSGEGSIIQTLSPEEGSAVEPPSAEGAKKEKEHKEHKDWCRNIPLATTAIATHQQKFQHEEIGVPDADSNQKTFFYQAARAHDARAGTSNIERLGWGTTAACYAGYIATLGFSVNKETYVRLGAAGFLGYVFHRKHNSHKSYAERATEIADSLPGKGDCNPITETDCYCAHANSTHYPDSDYAKYCLPAPPERRHGQPLPPGTTGVPCTRGDQGSFALDTHCDCVSLNNCADHTLAPLLAMEAFGPTTTTGQSMRALANLAKGQYNPTRFSNSSFGQNAFKKAMQLADQHLSPPEKPLSDKEKKIAQDLFKNGVPGKLASHLAQVNPAPSSVLKTAGFPVPRIQKEKDKTSSAQRLRSLPRGKKIFNRKRKVAGIGDSLLKRLKGSNKPSIELIKYSETAQQKASVSPDKGQGIFQLISHRYQSSGWEKLDYE